MAGELRQREQVSPGVWTAYKQGWKICNDIEKLKEPLDDKGVSCSKISPIIRF